jgi:hypothetical protein
MIRPRFIDQERILLIHALKTYATHLKILQAEDDVDRLTMHVLMNSWKRTQDLESIREFWKVRERVEANLGARFGDRADISLLLAKRLETLPLLVKVRGHHLNSAKESRLLLRAIPEEAWQLLP